MRELLNNLYSYRQLLKSNVRKEIRGKYKGSFLGVLWSFVNPLLTTLVYAIVFPIILKSNEPHYVTFIVIGILAWTYFTTVIMQGTTTILNNAGIVKKVYFPREILPISVNTSGAINFLISCVIIMIFLIFSGIGFSWYLLLLPVIIAIQYLLQLGIIFITGAINVYIRDAEYIINFIINMLFYATPILYTSKMFENSAFYWIFKLNPMAVIIDSYRDIMFYKQVPNIKYLLMVFAVSFILFYIGYKIFKKLERKFAEEI